jgi:hypothetical protein
MKNQVQRPMILDLNGWTMLKIVVEEVRVPA